MRYLVTGAAGFIGSHICDELLKRGHEVIAMDIFSTGSRENLAHLEGSPQLQIVQHDVNLPVEGISADFIMNFACPASPVHYQIDPIQTLKTSLLGTLNLVELARKLEVPIFHASTSEVYGDPNVTPQREDYWGNVNPIGPRACYDEGKRAAETLLFDFHRVHGVRIKVARIFNTYGPRMAVNDGRVVSNFIVQALRGEPITIYGDGTQTRSFCYVSDLVAGILALCGSDESVTGPINLGNPVEMTVTELAQRVIAATGSSSVIEFRELPTDDPKQRRPDISLAGRILDWTPFVELDSGIEMTAAYFRQKLGAS